MAGHGWRDLTRQEIAVLSAVGRRLGNAEIAAEFVVSVRTVESHIAALRRKLDVDSRAGLITAAQRRRGNAVPRPQNSFVGRESDLATVTSLLRRFHWVTVVGPAGVGKSRLGLELAAAGSRVPVVVDLEHATATDLLDAVAKAAGLGGVVGPDVLGACGVALAGAPSLLVLDNADRVSGPLTTLIRALRTAERTLAVLVTSRSPLGCAEEAVHHLDPLPTRSGTLSPAARLLLDRVAAAAPDLDVGAEDQSAIETICRQVDGLPLALELAAARTRQLPLGELAARLQAGLGSLAVDGPPRHRTLDAAFAWTWDLLDPAGQTALRRLAALPRSFDLDLADAVAGPGAGDLVLRLADRSLVLPSRTPGAGGPRRFRLLRPLREFVLARAEAAEVAEVRLRHARCHVALADHVRACARTGDDPVTRAEARRICPEVNAAAEWALPTHPELVLPLVRALAVGSEQFSPDPGSLGTISRAAQDPRVRAAASADALFELGSALCYGDLDLVAELAALALARAAAQPDDLRTALAAHHLAGWSDAYAGRSPSALAHLARAEELAVALTDRWQLASVRQARGIALRADEASGPDAVLAAFASSLTAYAAAGDAVHVSNVRYMMAATAAAAGRRTEEAIGWARRCVEDADARDNAHERAHAHLALVALGAGPGSEVLPAVVEVFRRIGDLRCLHRGLMLLTELSPPRERVPLLREAVAAASAAHDRDRLRAAQDALLAVQQDLAAAEVAALAGASPQRVAGRETDATVA